MNKDKEVIHKLKCISIISLVFMSVEIIGGIMANSIAILADAFHLLSDVLAYIISLQAVLMSHRIPPYYLTFGYQKLQPLGALVNVAIIWFVTLELVIEATERIINQSVVKDPLFMLLTSFFGLGCNLYIMKVLHSDTEHGGHQGCSHSHGLEHQNDHHHNHSHKQGQKCSHHHEHNHQQKKKNHGHSRAKIEKKKCNHQHGPHHEHNHDSTHAHTHSEEKHANHYNCEKQHNHSHDHDHDHGHHHQGHNHQGHNHNHQDHNHNHQGHNHNHHHDQDHHQHEQKQQIDFADSQRDFNSIQLKQNHHDEYGNQIRVSSQESLNQQLKLSDYISFKAETNQQNLSDESLRIYEKQKARKQLFSNINIQAAYIHIISDIILSIGVIISAIIIFTFGDPQNWTYWQLADPFCTYLFSIMAIYSTIGITKDSVVILLDGCDDKTMLKDITSELDTINQVSSYKQLRVWSMNRSKFAAAVKICLSKQNYDSIKARDEIRDRVINLFSSRKIIHYVEVEQQKSNILKEQ